MLCSDTHVQASCYSMVLTAAHNLTYCAHTKKANVALKVFNKMSSLHLVHSVLDTTQ